MEHQTKETDTMPSDIAPLASLPVLPPAAHTALAALEDAGYEAWCVGGFVRDALMDRLSADVDIATSACWQSVRDIFTARGYAVFETGTKHGTVTALVDGMRLEITTYRIDGSYLDNRHPTTVEFVRSIEEDLARRDFTVNAIAYHPLRGFRDPYDGCADIKAGILRAVGCPKKRFEEDALRILRGVRFASQLSFSLEAKTAQSMREQAPLMKTLAAERVAHELEGMLCGTRIHDTLLEYVDVLGVIMPELLPMKGFDQKTPYHRYDVLEHTAYVVQNTPPYPLVRWAALFHDFGKPRAFFTDDAGVGHFYGHAEISCELANTAMRRLKMSPRFADDVLLLVKHHDDVIEPTPRAVKRMLHRLQGRVDLFRALCDLKRGDALSQAPHCRARVEAANELEVLLDKILAAQEAFSLHDLAIKGGDVIALGVPAGPAVGSILEAALNAVIDEKLPNERKALWRFVKDTYHP
ncbi:MAG: HD domain-containing protein [Raoultibacter sp.]